MWAILAVVAFLVSFILHLMKSVNGAYWVDAELLGLVFLSVAVLAPGWWPRPPRQP